MKFFHTIRWRLQLWHGLLMMLVLAGFAFTAWRLQRATQFQRLDQELEQRMETIVRAIPFMNGPGRPPQNQPPPEDPPPDSPDFDRPSPPPFRLRLSSSDSNLFEGTPGNSFYYVVWKRDGREGSRSATAPPDVPRPERIGASSDWRMRGTLREHFHYTPMADCILVGRDIRGELADMRRFAWMLAGAGGLVLVLGLVGGAWLTTRALRPIRDISSAAGKIATGDLTQRISTADSKSELGQLVSVLNATFARLDAAFTQQARFTADAAHELRTPVTVMLTHVQNGLASECSNEEHREAFEASQRAAQRMRRLTESLLALARLDSSDAATHTPCALDRIACDATELLRPLAEEQKITLEVKSTPAPCEGNAEQLGQVITNLVSNAIYYNHPGGSVRVTVTTESGAAVLAVSDTGQGIAPEHLSHIFERFYRADQARSSAQGRIGLGLAITKAIIEAHGGTIEVATQLDQGSTFTVRLPGRSHLPELPKDSD